MRVRSPRCSGAPTVGARTVAEEIFVGVCRARSPIRDDDSSGAYLGRNWFNHSAHLLRNALRTSGLAPRNRLCESTLILRCVIAIPRRCVVARRVLLRKSPRGSIMTKPSDRQAKINAVRILAKSIYKDLEQQGFDEKQIVALATELISEVTARISQREPAAAPQHAVAR
jgi:hypothetical protein